MPSSPLPSSPLILNWALSNRCNFRCRHCYSRTEPRDELDSATLLGLVRKVAASRVLSVNFGGGEPLLREDLLQVAALASSLGMAVSLNSNGYLLDGPMAAQLQAAGVRKVGISIDSPDAATHDAFRGLDGSHGRALAALSHLAEVGIETSVSSVICQINHHDLTALADMAAGAGASWLNFHDFKCSGLGYANRDALDLSPAQWRAFYVEAIALRLARSDVRILMEDPVIALLGGQDTTSGVKGSVCGKLSLAVKANGDVTPCGFIPRPIGNLRTHDLGELWRTSPLLEAMRGKRPQGKCTGCGLYETCVGGCTARALAMTGDLNSPDPHCWA